MSKKVLAVYYTQSGQLGEIMDTFTAPMTEAGATVEKIVIEPLVNYDFPWTGERFFSVMPDCVLGKPAPLKPLNFKETAYDLVILGYQPWFLSPSIPSNSLLHDETFRNIIKDTPLITISAARNMWLNAFTRVRKLLGEAGARHVGNIALVDKHPNPVSFVTIFYWMLTGKRDRYLNIFPPPGVSKEDVQRTAVYGEIVARHLKQNSYEHLQEDLIAEKAVQINYKLMFIEARAKPIFLAWAKFIANRKNKTPWLSAFKYYLFIALFLGAPILLTLDAVFLKPFTSKRIKTKTLNYLKVN